MNYKVPKGTVDAARSLLAAGEGLHVNQVHDITLRDIDADEDNPSMLVLIPLGGVLGVAIRKGDEIIEDKDILFVSMSALGNCLPALGFSVRGPVAYIIPPESL